MIILIPAYEPDEKMLKLIDELRLHSSAPIVIIDDGSGLKYHAIFTHAALKGCKVLRFTKNMGKGAALKSGFSYIAENYPRQSVVTADCDGQHLVKDILAVGEAINGEQGNEIILGSRLFKGKVPLKSRFGNTLTRFIFSRMTGEKVFDTQTGLRGFSNKILGWLITIPGERFEYEINMLLQAKGKGIQIKEVPIFTVYENRNKGTHFHPIRDSVKVYMPLLKFGGSSFLSGCLDFILVMAFMAFSNNLLTSVVGARIISSISNYSMNHYAVFRGNQVKKLDSAPRYFGLVLLILILNYVLMAAFTIDLVLPLALSKLFVECLLFTLSFFIQKNFVFRPKEIKEPC